MDKNDIISSIAELEYAMFDAVNKGEARAECQDDKATFTAMRTAQFLAWPDEARESYLKDLQTAKSEGRNLLNEKYIHMMKTTEPAVYDALLNRVKLPSETAQKLANEICAVMLKETEALWAEFPSVSGFGRPLYSQQDPGGITSIQTYQLGELLTYSETTLAALKKHILALKKTGGSLSRNILENTVKSYGYASLEAGEAATKEWIDKIGIEVSYGCGCDDSCGI